MFEDAYLSKDVVAAVVQLLPVLLIALVASTGASMGRWVKGDRMTRSQRKKAKRSLRFFVFVVLSAAYVEITFLFALNDGDVFGWRALALWSSALTWLVTLLLAVLAENLPDMALASGHELSEES
jgi:hypothetical protein